MMLHLICYDIENNRARTRLSKLLIKIGMERVQLSVFIGVLSKYEKEELLAKIEELVSEDPIYHVLCIPLHEDMLSGLDEIAKVPLDWEYLKGEKLCMII
ncbi:CRISPR-associated endonuclease Cas2 [Marinilongibacter aquaticus]|uniref:CRISPR-associated endonuclease Cas2 n=1 Tax=Marinilongibacter aquaticus TaxID=2975157 RepID=UPI0021BD6886|nr:CRISPR-associated endonuclease Cas2 [Marinilongibacter aquaticus]UBM60768.1 CRISPR-associated endonuclease Cas2 [Marinilongibacter aquaticus]